MRLGVLDIGSNTGHLLVVDAHRGAAPLPAYSHKEPLRLAEHLDDAGAVSRQGIDALAAFTVGAQRVAEEKGCEDMLAFATSAVRDAVNSDAVLEEVRARTGQSIAVLAGEDEARLTFLAVRRWLGWSAGRLWVFDIGGGSLEIAGGADEEPDVAWSLPLGAARLARQHLPTAPVGDDEIRELRRQIRTEVARDAGRLLRPGPPDHAAATSKTFRSLARICGSLQLAALAEWIPKLAAMAHDEVAQLPGVSPSRAHQILPGALVAEAVMDIFGLPALEVCPWALREGVILERLDQISDLAL